MKVSISKAAEMAGITRATMYRHIEKKGITVEKDEDDNPKIDVSELVRVYGDQLKVTEEGGKINSDNTPQIEQPIQHDTPKIKHPIQDNTPHQIVSENQILQERIQNLESIKESLEKERSRERDQLNEEIDALRESLKNAQNHHHQLTALLTDQRSEDQKRGDVFHQQGHQIEEMRAALQNFMHERQEQNQRMEALEKRLLKMRESGVGKIKKLNERNKRLEIRNKKLEAEIKKPWFKKLVG